MGGIIHLNASMRSSLIALQQIRQKLDVVQARLANGQKVNSAIDNPSSYYTAKALNDRSADLSALLNSMMQGTQTIKAASEGIDSALKYLDQAKALANQVLQGNYSGGTTPVSPDTSPVDIDKNWLIANGIKASQIVDASNAANLQSIINNAANGDTVVVMGEINLDATTITLKEGVALVGAEYVAQKAGVSNYSVASENKAVVNIDQTSIAGSGEFGIIANSNATIANMSINYVANDANSWRGAAINVATGASGVELKDLNINAKVLVYNANTRPVCGIIMAENSSANLSGKVNMIIGQNTDIANSITGAGIKGSNTSHLTSSSGSSLNIDVLGMLGHAFNIGTYDMYGKVTAEVHDTSGSICYHAGNYSFYDTVNFTSAGTITRSSTSFSLYNGGVLNSVDGAINTSTGAVSHLNGDIYITSTKDGVSCLDSGKFEVNGNLNLTATGADSHGFRSSGANEVFLSTSDTVMNINSQGGSAFYGQLRSVIGSTIITKSGTYNCTTAATSPIGMHGDVPNAAYFTPQATNNLAFMSLANEADGGDKTPVSGYEYAFAQYVRIIKQMDTIVADSSYNGTNLLAAQDLTVVFDEADNSGYVIKGKDMSSMAVGIDSTTVWDKASAVKNSIKELNKAIAEYRQYSAEVGVSYGILQTRTEFTKSLINILTEGADKLILADLNEESANMLALQTSQSLAINALSLASQAEQSVLKLF